VNRLPRWLRIRRNPPGQVGNRLFDQNIGTPGAFDLGAHRCPAKTAPVFVSVSFRKDQKQPFNDGDGLSTLGTVKFGGIEVLEKTLRVCGLRTEPRSGRRGLKSGHQPALEITFGSHDAIFILGRRAGGRPLVVGPILWRISFFVNKFDMKQAPAESPAVCAASRRQRRGEAKRAGPSGRRWVDKKKIDNSGNPR